MKNIYLALGQSLFHATQLVLSMRRAHHLAVSGQNNPLNRSLQRVLPNCLAGARGLQSQLSFLLDIKPGHKPERICVHCGCSDSQACTPPCTWLENLFDVRAFQNGNCHFRLNENFMLALNVEHGRLQGWLHSGEQAAEELKNKDAAQYFKTNLQLNPANPVLLLAA